MAWYSSVQPLYKYGDLPDDLDNFSCGNWITYHNRLKSGFGKDKAISIVKKEVERVGMFADIHACKYDCDFVNFFEKEGYGNVGNIFSKTYCTSVQVVDTVGNTVKNTGDTIAGVGNVVNSLINTKTIIAGGLIFAVYMLNKNEDGKK